MSKKEIQYIFIKWCAKLQMSSDRNQTSRTNEIGDRRAFVKDQFGHVPCLTATSDRASDHQLLEES